jgi:hypothetical protein
MMRWLVVLAVGCRAAAAAPAPAVDADWLRRHCAAPTCASANEMTRCFGDHDVSVAGQVWVAGELRRCWHDPTGKKDAIAAALLGAAIQPDPAVSTAVRDALVDTKALTTAHAKLVPTQAQAVSAVSALLGKRTDGYEKITGDDCVITGESGKGLDVTCKTYDGCLRACMDRVRVATFQIDGSGWHLVDVSIKPADTGMCGDCE